MNFRNLIETWDENLLEEEDDLIQTVAEHPGLMLFFKKGDGVFAGPEESRVIFAKLKGEDEEITDDWKDEANFVALDLIKALAGENAPCLFSNKDMPEIEIMTEPKNVCNSLNKHAKKAPDPIAGLKKFLSSLGEE